MKPDLYAFLLQSRTQSDVNSESLCSVVLQAET